MPYLQSDNFDVLVLDLVVGFIGLFWWMDGEFIFMINKQIKFKQYSQLEFLSCLLSSKMLNSYPKNPEKQQKMITFLDKLHHKYQILSKLTQKQCQLFNNQVILLLVDQNQNVDQQAYREVIKNIGMDAFVLDVLGKCMNRNPFTNQYELKKNMSTIADNLQKQVKEVNKKMKIVQRKELQINQKQSGLKNKLKQYAIQLEKQSMNKLINKENQIKKNINSLLNNVRAKEKIVQDRREEILGKLVEISNREKNLGQRQKQLVKKSSSVQLSGMQIQTEIPNNQVTGITVNRAQANNGMKQMRELNKKFEQCKNELQKLKKKYKTTEMAYSKVKNDLTNSIKDNQKFQLEIAQLKKQLQDQRTKNIQLQKQKSVLKNIQKPKSKQAGQQKIQINLLKKTKQAAKQPPGANKNQLIDMLEMLEISEIGIEDDSMSKQKQNCQFYVNKEISRDEDINQIKRMNGLGNLDLINKKKYYTGNQLINGSSKKCEENPAKQMSVQESQNQADDDEDIPRTLGMKPSLSHIYQDSPQKSELSIPKFLTTDNTNPTSILTQITNILSNPQTAQPPTLTLIQHNHLLNFAKLPSFHHNKNNLTEYLDTILTLIQQSNPHYYELIEHLGRNQFTQFFQLCYLNYQSILQITEATTLILSRIMMLTSVDIEYRVQFITAIKVRAKAINTHRAEHEQFLHGNINCLLSMIHT